MCLRVSTVWVLNLRTRSVVLDVWTASQHDRNHPVKIQSGIQKLTLMSRIGSGEKAPLSEKLCRSGTTRKGYKYFDRDGKPDKDLGRGHIGSQQNFVVFGHRVS